VGSVGVCGVAEVGMKQRSLAFHCPGWLYKGKRERERGGKEGGEGPTQSREKLAFCKSQWIPSQF
jgi:hypothetical protein